MGKYLIVFALIFFPTVMHAQATSDSISVVGHWNGNSGGRPGDIFLEDNIAYIAAGRFLQIYDISNPLNPELLSNYSAIAVINGIKTANNYAYLSVGYGLIILDVSNLYQPSFISSYNSTDSQGHSMSTSGIEIQNNIAYLFGYELDVVDVLNPYSPVKVGSYFPGGNVFGQLAAIAYNNLIYVSGPTGLRIVNFENPGDPQLVGEFVVDSCSGTNISVSNEKVYLVSHKNYNELSIIDISIPGNPTELSTTNISTSPFTTYSIAVNNNTLLCGLGDVYQFTGKLKAFDVSNPYSPYQSDEINLPQTVSKMYSGNDICFSSASDTSVILVDIMDPGNLTIINSINTNASSFEVLNCDAKDSIAVLALGNKGIKILNVTNPEALIVLSSMQFDGSVSVLRVINNYLYLNDNNILRVIDIDNPEQPVAVSALGFSSNIRSIEFNNGYLLVCGSFGLSVIDISNPNIPQEIGELSGEFSDIVLKNNYAYLLAFNIISWEYIQVVNLSSPSNPIPVYSFEPIQMIPSGLKVNENYLYICGELTEIYSIGNPSVPSFISSLNIPSTDLAADEGFIYLADSPKIKVLDSNYTQVGLLNLPGADNVISLELENHLIYASWRNNGLYILRNDMLTSVSNPETNDKFPDDFFLSQNYPNPFNPATNIKFYIPISGWVYLKAYDVLGREVETLVNDYKSKGSYQVTFIGNNLPSGVYFYRIQAGNYSEVKKMILLR